MTQETQTSELLPCPCCGGEAKVRGFSINEWVECTACGLCTDDHIDHVRLWNTRTSPERAEPVLVIDLDKEDWTRIKQAANNSKWIPPEYYVNDWVSDVCDFLENGHSAALSRPSDEETLGQLARQAQSLLEFTKREQKLLTALGDILLNSEPDTVAHKTASRGIAEYKTSKGE